MGAVLQGAAEEQPHSAWPVRLVVVEEKQEEGQGWGSRVRQEGEVAWR